MGCVILPPPAPTLRRFTAADLRAAISSDYEIVAVTPLRADPHTTPQDGRYRVDVRLLSERGYYCSTMVLPRGVTVYYDRADGGRAAEIPGANDTLVADLDNWDEARLAIQPEYRPFAEVRPDRHQHRWWRIVGPGCGQGVSVEAHSGARWNSRRSSASPVSWLIREGDADDIWFSRRVTPENESGEIIPWSALPQEAFFRRGLPSPAQVAAHTSGLWESQTALNPPGGSTAAAERRQPRTRWHLLNGTGIDGLRHVYRREADGAELLINPTRREWASQSFRPIADDGTPVPWSTVEAATSTTPPPPPLPPDVADIARRLVEIVGANVAVRSVKHDGANTIVEAVTSSTWPNVTLPSGAQYNPGSRLAEQPAPLPRGVLVNVTNKHGVIVPLRGIEEPAPSPSERRRVDASEITRRLHACSTSYRVVGRTEDGKLAVENVGAVVAHTVISRKIPAGIEYIVVDGDGAITQQSSGTDNTITLDVAALPLYQPPRYFAEDGDTAWSKQVPRWLTQAVQKVGAVSAHWQIVNSDGAKRLTFRFPWGVNTEAKQREIYDNSTISGKTTKIFVAVKTECMPAPRVPVSLVQQIRTDRNVSFADLGTDGRDWANAPSWSDKPLLNTVVAVIRDIVAASPQLTDEQVAERANCYADIVEEARCSGTEASEVARRYCERWLNRFALLEINDRTTTTSPPAQLKLSKKPLTLDAIAKAREVLAKNSGTQEDAKKAAGLDDLEIYFLSRWARGLSDGEALAWWQRVTVEARTNSSGMVDVAAFDAVASRTKPAPTIDPDTAANPQAAISAWQQRQHERREQERKWRQRRVVEEVVAAEPCRWDLLELDGAVPVPVPSSRPAIAPIAPTAPPTYRPPAPRHIDAPTPPPCPHYVDATMLPTEIQTAVVFGAMVEAVGQRQYDN